MLKGHVGTAPVRKRNFGQLCAAVRPAHDRVAEIGAFESALDVSYRPPEVLTGEDTWRLDVGNAAEPAIPSVSTSAGWY